MELKGGILTTQSKLFLWNSILQHCTEMPLEVVSFLHWA